MEDAFLVADRGCPAAVGRRPLIRQQRANEEADGEHEVGRQGYRHSAQKKQQGF